jgi:hypothetical protein
MIWRGDSFSKFRSRENSDVSHLVMQQRARDASRSHLVGVEPKERKRGDDIHLHRERQHPEPHMAPAIRFCRHATHSLNATAAILRVKHHLGFRRERVNLNISRTKRRLRAAGLQGQAHSAVGRLPPGSVVSSFQSECDISGSTLPHLGHVAGNAAGARAQ